MELDIGGYYIRSWTLDDAPAIVKYANNRSIWLKVRDSFPHPYTLEEAELSIELALESRREIRFAIATEAEAIGAIGLTLMSDVHRRTAEIGYWIAEPYWDMGIATKAVVAFTKYAFDQFDPARIFGEVFEGNESSGRVLQKAGYTFEGQMHNSITKDGKTFDSFIYAITR